MEEELSQACVAWKKELQQDIESIQAVGDFAVKRNFKQFVNPALEIDGSLIPLPLIPLLADRIKAVAKPATFSKHGANMVDYSASLIWELHHDQFRIINPSWPEFLESIKQDVAHGLGMAPSDIDVEPDKLLLYEKGSFIGRHKDSELTPGFTGRLLICLPSEHRGGEVRLEHSGRDHAYASAPDSTFDLSALAWYSGVTHEVAEIGSGHRLELTYIMTQRSGTAKSADFFIKQQARLKERIVRWPGGLPRLAYFLDHKYSQADLCPSTLKARDRAVVEGLSSGCSEAGIYLFLSNVTKKEYDRACDPGIHSDDDDEIGIYTDCLRTTEGKKIASGLWLSEQHLMAVDPYSNRSADGEEEGDGEGYLDDDSIRSKLIYHDSAVILIPRNKLQHLLGSRADVEAMMALVINDQKNHPSDVIVQVDMLEFMNEVLYFSPPRHIGYLILESAWNLKYMPLYHEALRYCTSGGYIPKELPKLLAAFVTQSPCLQEMNWSEWLDDLLGCSSIDVGRIFVALNDFEQALDNKHLLNSFRAWLATMKRDRFISSKYLTVGNHQSIQEIANLFWHDQDWVEQRQVYMFIHALEHCEDRALVGKIIKNLAAKDSDNTLPGAREAAKKILNMQLPRLCLEPVNMLSATDQQAANEVDRFIDTVGVCLTSGFMEEALRLIENINLNVQPQQHYPEPRPVGTRTGTAYVPNLAHRFVCMLGDLLAAHMAPFMESLRDLFENLLRHYALPPFPIFPARLAGWAHRPRGCSAFCKPCKELDLFLTDPNRKVADFSHLKRAHIHDHVIRRLPSEIFNCIIHPKGNNFYVDKISPDGDFRKALSAYEDKARALRDCTKDFHGEHFRKILGEDLYCYKKPLGETKHPLQLVLEGDHTPGASFRSRVDRSVSSTMELALYRTFMMLCMHLPEP
ncbi:hypothetical protein INS49_006831 [Diaporthe citri]|uniref:uncharacterized protein n=1 Tax=Diaporthe citri TaxID=83186 RepID=UPI001C7E9709|nr:uncharacterized protein INS49_006831 [Diaporthe citri]KAG6365222.1 hypothetical protein INS49_006831 [Diaporthe citri]